MIGDRMDSALAMRLYNILSPALIPYLVANVQGALYKHEREMVVDMTPDFETVPRLCSNYSKCYLRIQYFYSIEGLQGSLFKFCLALHCNNQHFT